MPNTPLVSVMVLNYNGRTRLGSIIEDCLASLFSTDYSNFELLFVDNASTDGTVEFVSNKFGQNPRLHIVRNRRNLGFAEGNNRGMKIASGEYIALINSDTRVDPAWLKELVQALEPREVGAVQSKLLSMQSPDLLDSAGGLVDYYGYHFERGRGEQALSYDCSADIFYAKGAAVLLKRDVLRKTGLFDSDIFLYFDDVDLCWRIWLSGHLVLYAPTSVVYHASGRTASPLKQRQKMFLYVRNHILVLLKNYDLANAFDATIVSLLFEVRNFALILLRGKPLVALSVIRGVTWNLAHFKATWRKRQVVQSQIRKVSDEDIKKRMLKPLPPFPLYILFPRTRYTLQ